MMGAQFFGSDEAMMDLEVGSQRDERVIARVSRDSNRAYDALQKFEEKENRLRFELETLLSMEQGMLEEHPLIDKEIEELDRENQLLDHENATLEARAALAAEKLKNTKRLFEEKKAQVDKQERDLEDLCKKSQNHRQEIDEVIIRTKSVVQDKLAEYRSMPLCNEYYDMKNKVKELTEKRDKTREKLEQAQQKVKILVQRNKEEWQKFVKNCIAAAENYKRCKEEAMEKNKSSAKRAQDILNRHHKKREFGNTVQSASKYTSSTVPYLSAWSRCQQAGGLYSNKFSTGRQYIQQSSIPTFSPLMREVPYSKSRELMDKLNAIKLRSSFITNRKRISANVEDTPIAKKPADATSVLKNVSFGFPTPPQDYKNPNAQKNDLLCVSIDRHQKAQNSGSFTNVSSEQPTLMTTSRYSTNESMSLNAELKRSITSTAVQNLQQSQANDGYTAFSTPPSVSASPGQKEFVSQSSNQVVSLNNMNVSINVNVSQSNNALNTTQQLLGDGNGSGTCLFGSPGFNKSRGPTPVPSPRDFSAMVGHQLGSFAAGVAPILSSPETQFQQQGIMETTASPNFLSLKASDDVEAATSATPDFFMNFGARPERSSSPGLNYSFFEQFKSTPTPSSANEGFSFNTNFGRDDSNVLPFTSFGLTGNGFSDNDDFNNSRPFF